MAAGPNALRGPGPNPTRACAGGGAVHSIRSRHWETMAYSAAVAAFLDKCGHLGRVRKKERVAARMSNALRLRPLRHESLEVRIDHSVLHGNYCVARLLFPSRNCGLRLQRITRNRYLGYRHKTRD